MKSSWGWVAAWYIGIILSVCLCVVLGEGVRGSWWEPCCFTACGGQNHSLDGVHAHICDYRLMKLSRADGREKQTCPVPLPTPILSSVKAAYTRGSTPPPPLLLPIPSTHLNQSHPDLPLNTHVLSASLRCFWKRQLDRALQASLSGTLSRMS